MSRPQIIIVVDPDAARSATIAANLRRVGSVVVQLGWKDELVALSAGNTAILVADEDGNLPRLFARMKEAGLASQVIAYSTSASPHRIVQALSLGAADYLVWPCDASLIVAAATMSIASRELRSQSA